MATKQIPNLPPVIALAGPEQLELVQAGTSKRGAISQISDYVIQQQHAVAPPALTDFSPRSYGAVGDGVTDDTAALQAAIDYVFAQGGGIVNCTGGRWLIDSADLILRKGVTLGGPWMFPGLGDGALRLDISSYNSVLIINSAYTIRVLGFAAAIRGLAIFAKAVWNNPMPTTLRQNLDRAALFAGTAIVIGDGVNTVANDFFIEHCCIGGFQYGIDSNFASRPHIDYLFLDNNNGIHVTKCFDMDYIANVHCWPFLTASGGTTSMATYNVSNAVNNGAGLVRITTSAPHILVTGDTNIVVSAVGGVTAANGTWTVTVINSTTFDLQGSAFAGAYTSGGTVGVLVFKREGIGIFCDSQSDWAQLTNCFCYGYQVAGIKLSNSNHGTLMNCGTDNYAPLIDTVPIGIQIDGTSGATALIGCKTAAAGVGLKIDISAPFENNVTVTNYRSWGLVTYALQVVNGTASFVNCEVQTTEVVRVEAGATLVSFIGGDLTGTTMSYATGAPQAQFIGVSGSPVAAHQMTSRGASGTRPMLKQALDNQTAAANDSTYQSVLFRDSAGTLVETNRTSYRVSDVTAGAMTSSMFWAIDRAGTFANVLQLDTNGFGPLVSNSFTLGYPTSKWSTLHLASIPVASLPPPATMGQGARAHVSDSNTTVFNAIVAAGGANIVPVFCDGTNWRVG